MTNVTRYTCGAGDGMFEEKKGNWVAWEDYQKLNNELQQLLNKHNVSGRSEQLPPLDDETVLEPMQNALYATNSFTTDQCSTLAEGILMYIKEAGMKIVPCGNCH